MTELRTQRLVLRAPRLDDAPCYALGIGEYEVTRWLTAVPWPYTLAMARDWLYQAPDNRPGRALFAIEHPEKGVIGSISLISELGFWIARPHWGRGYVTEAARALLDWHFADRESDMVFSGAHHNNAASLAVQAKLGFQTIGREQRFSHALQHNVDHVVTRLNRADWLQRDSAR